MTRLAFVNLCEPRLRSAFLHLRFGMFAAWTIENEYLRNPFNVRDGANKIHRLPAVAQGPSGSLIFHELLKCVVDGVCGAVDVEILERKCKTLIGIVRCRDDRRALGR